MAAAADRSADRGTLGRRLPVAMMAHPHPPDEEPSWQVAPAATAGAIFCCGASGKLLKGASQTRLYASVAGPVRVAQLASGRLSSPARNRRARQEARPICLRFCHRVDGHFNECWRRPPNKGKAAKKLHARPAAPCQ